MKLYANALAWLGCFVGIAISAFAKPILMSELMYHPQSENSLEEYIELLNTGTNTVNLAGWRFTTGIRFTFPQVSLPPGAYWVVVANEAFGLSQS